MPANLVSCGSFSGVCSGQSLSKLARELSRSYYHLAVQAASLEVLEKAAVPPAQARAIVQAIEIEIAGAKDTLATKQDILLLKQDITGLRHETSQLRTELKSDIAGVRTELKADIAELRAELKGDLAALGAELRVEFKGDWAELRAEFKGDWAELRAEFKGDLAGLRAGEIAGLRLDLASKLDRSEFQAAMTSHLRHMYGAIMGAIMGQFALLLGVAYFFVSHVQR